jgi:large subunit ribosomal protein L30e
MVEVDKVLKSTVKKGKVKIGTKETKQALKNGKAKLVVIAENCPHETEITSFAKKKKIPVYNYKNNSINLGYTCGKAFAVSVFAVMEDGGSNILNLVKKSS